MSARTRDAAEGLGSVELKRMLALADSDFSTCMLSGLPASPLPTDQRSIQAKSSPPLPKVWPAPKIAGARKSLRRTSSPLGAWWKTRTAPRAQAIHSSGGSPRAVISSPSL